MKNRPNFLIIMVDEERFPPIYESKEVRKWRKKNLIFHELMRKNGLEFMRHYIGSAACSPSRTTLFTGQYPSLHGVTQTTGAAKGAFDPDVFWLDSSTVPTMGDYFREAGYQTFYKGKWHISDEDILIPGTHNAFPSYNSVTGVPVPEKERIYLEAEGLRDYGFTGWIGPEPHGTAPRNSGSSASVGLSGRDVVYSQEAVQLIKELDKRKSKDDKPWLMVTSFVNPHDIALFGEITERLPQYNFEVDDDVPNIPPPPTLHESLATKPDCQESYRKVYPKVFQPTPNNDFYRRLYYQLHKNADEQALKVFKTLQESSFYENTIILFTADHGDLMGAHGGLHQKWYCAYEEVVHVPFIIHNPRLFKKRKKVKELTSHVDIIPTLLGLAGIDVKKVQRNLRKSHNEVHPLVGKDLSSFILSGCKDEFPTEPVYFMTDDDVSKGLNQVGLLGPYSAVVQPNHIETVVAFVKGKDGKELWKYSRYYDNPQFWSDPGVEDVVTEEAPCQLERGNEELAICVTTTKTERLPDQFEMYNLSADPLETVNLAYPSNQTAESIKMEKFLAALLDEECQKKRLMPTSGTVPGMLSCEEI